MANLLVLDAINVFDNKEFQDPAVQFLLECCQPNDTLMLAVVVIYATSVFLIPTDGN